MNPFTPSNKSISGSTLRLRALNSPRFSSDFHKKSILGSGSYGEVFKAVKRIEGIFYAVKVAKKPLHLKDTKSNREICAMASLGIGNENLVRYYRHVFYSSSLTRPFYEIFSS